MSIKQLTPFVSTLRGPAFRGIQAILQEDSKLALGVKTWSVRQNDPDEMQAPTPDMTPMIALSPMPNPNTTASERDNRVNFVVGVQLFAEGTAFEDIAGMWEAVEAAIVHDKPFRDGTVTTFLCNLLGPNYGVMNLRAVAPAFVGVKLGDKSNQGDSPNMQSGLGSLTCFLRTPA